MESAKKSKSNDIDFDGLSYTVSLGKSKSKEILKAVNGHFKSGELTAIMGPSGAGKSSLLNILTGFTRYGVKGNINMNCKSNKSNSKQCSYILQEDQLYKNFNVEETMMLAANLKIGGVSPEKKKVMVDNILSQLHLSHSKRSKCGKLSGGQRKRLSIALELLDNRPVLFLDEPTTGLDSLATAYCVRLLKKLARDGRTIVCTIHQPAGSVYEMFDHIYVLADGHCIYQGAPENTVAYLRSVGLNCPQYHNSADYLLEVANAEYGAHNDELTKAANDVRWRRIHTKAMINNGENGEVARVVGQLQIIEPSSTKAGGFVMNLVECNANFHTPSEWTQLWALVNRCFVHYHRDWTVTYLKLVCHIFVAVIMGLMFGDSGRNATKSIANIGLLLANVMYMWYTAIMPSVLKFPSEITIIKKETFNNWYRLRTYFLANMMISTPIQIIFATTFSTIIFLMTDQPLELERFLKFTIVLMVLNILADSLGLTIGAVLDPINGTFIGAILTIFKISLSGFLAVKSQVAATFKITMYLSSMNYALEALVLSILDFNRGDIICPESVIYCHYKAPEMIIEELGMVPRNYVFDVGIMAAQMIAAKCIAFYALHRRVNGEL